MIDSLQKISDQFLWKAVLNGNKTAFADLYKKYFDLLYEYGMRICYNPEVVKDCIQDLFIKLWSNRNNLSITATVKPYLYTSIRNVILNRLDKEKHVRERADKTAYRYDFEMKYDDIENNLIREEENQYYNTLIIRALEQLTPRQKECIYLRFYSGLSYKEISSVMNISIKATYKITGRATGFLRKYLKEMAVYSLMLLVFISYLF